MKANRVMTRNVVCVSGRASLSEAFDLMGTLGIRHLPVVHETELVGIVSDRDFLLSARAVGEEELTLPDRTVSEIMTNDPVTCTLQATVAEVAGLMIDHRIDAVPVVGHDGELVGLITSTDLLELCRTDALEAKVIPFEFRVHLPAQIKLPTSNSTP